LGGKGIRFSSQVRGTSSSRGAWQEAQKGWGGQFTRHGKVDFVEKGSSKERRKANP